MFPRARNELISEQVEVTLVHRQPSTGVDRFTARVHVTAGTIRLRPIDTTKRGIKMNTALFAGAPSAVSSEEGKEGEEEKEETLMATLEFKDDLETLYKTALFKVATRPDAFDEVAEKFRNLLHYAWCDPPQDPSTPCSQPLPTKESSQSENGGAETPSLKRSATSPDSSSKRALSVISGRVERGASSEEGGSRLDLKSVEEYRKLAKFFEEAACAVYRLDKPKRARIVRIITDLVELTTDEQ